MSDLFPDATYRDIRLQDMLDELEREIKVRKRVYPRWVEAGKLDPVTADRRILCLQAIRKILALEAIREILQERARGAKT